MIGRVYRGGKVAGLMRYLYGPGRHNEHVDQRLVAAWDDTAGAGLRVLEPDALAGGGFDVRGLVAELEAPLAYANRPDKHVVWHCPLRTAPGDRVLTDAEWAGIAQDLMHRTGIAERGDPGGCRWVAVRHDADSVHVVAVLARQDGAVARVSNDYRRVRDTCLAAEQRYGLVVTAPADVTAARHTQRGEVEKAGRAGLPPARDWLRGQVQHAAAGSREPVEFLDRLRAAGVVVKERRNEAGALSGYAVGRREPGRDVILFGGGKLAADLSLPRLEARWSASVRPAPPAGGAVIEDDLARHAVWNDAIGAAAAAADEVRAHAGSSPEAAGDAAAAAADVLAAAGRLLEGELGGPISRAAADYDRAARETYGRQPVPSGSGDALRFAAVQLIRAGVGGPRKSDAIHVAVLLAQMARLAESVAELRAAQQRHAQAAAAARTGSVLTVGSGQWMRAGELDAAERQQSAATRTAAAIAALQDRYGPVSDAGPARGAGDGRSR